MISTVRDYLLSAVADATTLRVVREGESFKPKLADYPFARFSILPRESVLRDISSLNTTQEGGLVAVTLYYPRGPGAVDEALAEAESIMAALPVQNTLIDEDNQLMVTASWVEAVRHEEAAVGVPVFIRWANLA